MTVNKPSDLSQFSVLLPPVPISGNPASISTMRPGYPEKAADREEIMESLVNSIHINSVTPYWLSKSNDSLFWFVSS